ncbi:elongin A, like isoform X2 [Poecilia reticulata]|uniref:elongin A, like isoform X2 n=1 Tax=Poecilia reticulata TaxID=8081 RepID=UPI0004A2A168|nr:PREDICTED: transcription elongation factor B polypeptide 3-like isoform X2 [Poecilia reticulata]
MARSSDVVKRIMRFKLQLSDKAEPTTVLKILQKLKDLDITLDILSETGIGKTVNSLRRHKQVGEFAKLLVKGWKKMIPKESTSHGDDPAWLDSISVKNKEDDQSCSDNGSPQNDNNNNCPTSNHEDQDTSDEQAHKMLSKKEEFEEQKRKLSVDKNVKKRQEESKTQLWKDISKSRAEIQEDKMDDNVASKMRKQNSNNAHGNKSFEGSYKKSKSESREKLNGTSERERESNTKSKPSKELMKNRETFSSNDKYSKTLKLAKEDKPLEMSRSSETRNRKRKKTDYEKHDNLKPHPDPDSEKYSKHKKAKMGHQDAEINGNEEKPSMSFESYLNYDVNVEKKKEHSGVKKAPKMVKTSSKEPTSKHPGTKPLKSSTSFPEQTQKSLMHLMDVPLPVALPELEKSSHNDYYFEKKVDKEPDSCDVSEESVVFTGQRLNKKMQVYSGAKTLFLPTMMSLFQQCIRTLQNNLNLLYETGGVPFELLEPVLERCTPEQLLRIEEYNPIYIGVTDHLWGKHCQRDFKDCKLQEYESWKEMYIRLSEERERKLKRLTKTIVSAQSQKPKGRQVKMAFIHTVAKPPRDVRIQQEIHGTAVQQPHQLKCSNKHQENPMRSSCNEPYRSSSTSGSGGSNNQDPRKKIKVAPMMAKSLKAFRKQLGRR